ncbi:MAG: hypothetical protein J5509_04090, partial [Lachnospiraceae bacterium]|nr:hypothetical protein [Lachnospiraceae bacterium]
ERIFFTETLPDNTVMRAVVRRISVNKIKNVSAVVMVILEIVEESAGDSLDFAQIAQALSADFVDLYYVNIDNEKYIEFLPDPGNASVSVKKSGENFFETSRTDALKVLVGDDAKRFNDEFTRENVLRSIEDNGYFRITYQIVIAGTPLYAGMKAVRMDDKHIIIGVSDVDAQMKLQKEYDNVKAERQAYSRIMALVGNYICIYLVDPETEDYETIGSSQAFESTGIPKKGEGFFEETRKQSLNAIYTGDVDLFNVMFTKEKMLEEIKKTGAFTMIYRLMIGGNPNYVQLKASMLNEDGADKLIVGVSYYS